MMSSSNILQNISRFVQLDKNETEFLESVLIPRSFKQGEMLIKAGDAARYSLFVNAGYIITYYTDAEGTDHVIQFSGPAWWCGDFYSLSEQPATIYSTKALSDGEVLLLPRLAHQQLLQNYIKFERYFRIIFQRGVMRHQLRFVESYSSSAYERYNSFITYYPEIEQYVPQKFIASYLGITPEFLSKVRKKVLQGKS